MAVDIRKKIEVKALHGVIEDLDYYSVLRLKGGAAIPQVQRAFAKQSQEFHPDRFFGVRDPKFMKMVTVIFKKITEAYSVLHDPDLKKMYDQKMGFRAKVGARAGGEAKGPGTGGHRHVGKAVLEAERAAEDGEDFVKDKKARKYWELAKISIMNEDWNGVVMNLQFSLTYEEHPILRQKLDDAKIKMAEAKSKDHNPYKIRIV
jgi:DnaJ-class molecular chaperone